MREKLQFLPIYSLLSVILGGRKRRRPCWQFGGTAWALGGVAVILSA
jgi:hypothetical protein